MKPLVRQLNSSKENSLGFFKTLTQVCRQVAQPSQRAERERSKVPMLSSDSTWEPCENIFAKNLIDDFEKEAENSKSAKKRKKSARQNDEDFTPEEDIVAGQSRKILIRFRFIFSFFIRKGEAPPTSKKLNANYAASRK